MSQALLDTIAAPTTAAREVERSRFVATLHPVEDEEQAALVGADLTGVVAVVTRWFGGTLLGAGGLVRAYGGTLSEALARAQRLRREAVVLLEVAAPIGVAGRLDHELHQPAGTQHLAGLLPDVEVVACGWDIRPVPVSR